jgi:hypothetical protein
MKKRMEEPSNKKMQQTRSGHSRWRPSQLILVFCGHPSMEGST